MTLAHCQQDENMDIIYINEKLNRPEWHTFVVGKTRFNDEALRQAGKQNRHLCFMES